MKTGKGYHGGGSIPILAMRMGTQKNARGDTLSAIAWTKPFIFCERRHFRP